MTHRTKLKQRARKRNRLHKLYRIVMERLQGVDKVEFQRAHAGNPRIHNH